MSFVGRFNLSVDTPLCRFPDVETGACHPAARFAQCLSFLRCQPVGTRHALHRLAARLSVSLHRRCDTCSPYRLAIANIGAGVPVHIAAPPPDLPQRNDIGREFSLYAAALPQCPCLARYATTGAGALVGISFAGCDEHQGVFRLTDSGYAHGCLFLRSRLPRLDTTG